MGRARKHRLGRPAALAASVPSTAIFSLKQPRGGTIGGTPGVSRCCHGRCTPRRPNRSCGADSRNKGFASVKAGDFVVARIDHRRAASTSGPHRSGNSAGTAVSPRPPCTRSAGGWVDRPGLSPEGIDGEGFSLRGLVVRSRVSRNRAGGPPVAQVRAIRPVGGGRPRCRPTADSWVGGRPTWFEARALSWG